LAVTPYFSSDAFYTLTVSSPMIQTTTVSVDATDANASFATGDPGTFTITRTGSLTQPLTVSYMLSGTAKNGVDYNQTALSAIILAGKSSVTVTITPKTGGSKPTKTAILTLSSSANYGINAAKSAATITIQANNVPAIGVVATDPTASDTAAGPTSTGDFTLKRSTATGSNTVTLSVGGSAVYGADYTITVYGAQSFSYNKTTKLLTVTLSAGESAASIVVTPIHHASAPAKTVLLAIQASTAFNIAPGQSSATVTIAAH
jgi:hypothetical protein